VIEAWEVPHVAGGLNPRLDAVSSINLWCVLVGPRVGALDVTSMLSESGELEVRSGWIPDLRGAWRSGRLCAQKQGSMFVL
jgi:hypothetical protein